MARALRDANLPRARSIGEPTLGRLCRGSGFEVHTRSPPVIRRDTGSSTIRVRPRGFGRWLERAKRKLATQKSSDRSVQSSCSGARVVCSKTVFSTRASLLRWFSSSRALRSARARARRTARRRQAGLTQRETQRETQRAALDRGRSEGSRRDLRACSGKRTPEFALPKPAQGVDVASGSSQNGGGVVRRSSFIVHRYGEQLAGLVVPFGVSIRRAPVGRGPVPRRLGASATGFRRTLANQVFFRGAAGCGNR